MPRQHRTRSQSAPFQRGMLVMRRVERLDPTVRGLLWVGLSGFLFVLLNALVRGLAQQ